MSNSQSGVAANYLQVAPTALRQEITIAADHPALAGHFPGRPIIPGVVLLDQVILAACAWLNVKESSQHCEIANAKFLSPVAPGEALQLQLNRQSSAEFESLRFEISSGERRIASGALRLRQASS